MQAKQNVIINERTIKGYIELHKSYCEPLSDGKVMTRKVLPIMGVGGVIAGSLALFLTAPIQIIMVPVIAANVISIAVIDIEQVKERKELQKKYPYLDLTLSCEDLEEILLDNEAIVYDDECFYHYDEEVLDRKKYVEKCEEVLKEVTSENKDYSIPKYNDVPKVEIPKVKKLGTIQDARKRISK